MSLQINRFMYKSTFEKVPAKQEPNNRKTGFPWMKSVGNLGFCESTWILILFFVIIIHMKLAIRSVVFHMLCIFIFAIIYLYFSTHFVSNNGDKDFIDFLLLSTTIQAGVGVTDLYPISYYSKVTMIAQQIIMLTTHVFTLYIFTL